MSAAATRELSVAFGYRKQTNITTANILADIWRLHKVNPDLIVAEFVKENDAGWLGKGDEFPTTEYKSHINMIHSLTKFSSSEFLAWAAAFALGGVVKAGAGPYTYTCTPLDPITGGIEMPYFSYLEAVRQGGTDLFDRMYVGCAVEGFLVNVKSGPGLANSQITVDFVGSGKITDPSGITHPAATTEHIMPGASVAKTTLTIDYVTLKRLLSVEWGWRNNLRNDEGYYPGSGTQDGYAIKGRLWHGDREGILRFQAIVEDGSTEYAALRDLTTGTAVITQTFDADNTYTATFQKVAFRVAQIADANGLITVNVEATVMKHASNGVLSVVAITPQNNICQAPV